MALDLKVIISALNLSGTGINKAAADLQKLEARGKALQSVGLGIAGAGAAIGGGLLLAANSAAAMGETFLIASAKTGSTVEQLSALRYAAEKSDVSFETLAMSMTRMARAAAEGKLDEFGISVRDAGGDMKTTDAILLEFVGYLERLPDQASKTAAMMKVFGRGGAALAPLLNQGTAGIKALTDEAQKMGLVMTKEGAESADAMGDELEALKMTAKGLVGELGTSLAPTLKDLIVQVREVTGRVHAWMDEHPELVKQLSAVASKGALLLIAIGGITFIAGSAIRAYKTIAEAMILLKGASLASAAAQAKTVILWLLAVEVWARVVSSAVKFRAALKAVNEGRMDDARKLADEIRDMGEPWRKGFWKFSGIESILSSVDEAFGVTEIIGVGTFDELIAGADDLKVSVGGVRDETQGLGADLGALAPAAGGGAAAGGGGGITMGGIAAVAGALATAYGAAGGGGYGGGPRREVFGPGISGYEVRSAIGGTGRGAAFQPMQVQGPVGNATLAPRSNAEIAAAWMAQHPGLAGAARGAVTKPVGIGELYRDFGREAMGWMRSPAGRAALVGGTLGAGIGATAGGGVGALPGMAAGAAAGYWGQARRDHQVRHSGTINVRLEGDAADRQWTPEERRRFEQQLGEVMQAGAYAY